MNLNTLALYLYAGGLSVSLSVVLLVLARLRPGTRLLRSSAYATSMLALGFLVSGYGPSFPSWVTVIGTNLVLLGAFTVFYSGVEAFAKHQPPRANRFGFGLLVFCSVAFWYWGLVEPNGSYRSVVFSIAAGVINGRTTYQLARSLPGQWRKTPHLVLTALFGIAAVWMLGRAGLLLLADAPPTPSRGNNPTTWITVFWYIVLVSAMTACVVWAEFSQRTSNAAQESRTTPGILGQRQHMESKPLLLWALVLITLLGGVSEMGVYYTKTDAVERSRMTQATELANVALANQTRQVMSQVDTLLHSVRGFHLNSQSLEKTEAFINALPFDKTVIENVYLISPRGEIVISHDPGAQGRSVVDRDYFVFLKSAGTDEVFIGSAEVGRVTQQMNFRVARRISNLDGSFGGVVLATVRPESFSSYHEKLTPSAQSIAVVLGTLDHKFRGRSPALPPDRWQTPLESPLWELIKQSPSGTYTNTSTVDNIQRIFVYRKVDDWPLVVATGFSESDIRSSVQEQLRWFAIAVLAASAVVLTLAILLTIEVRRRDEQDRFLAMLSHELKTPLSVLRMGLQQSGALSASTRTHAQQAVHDMDSIVERCLQVDRLPQSRSASQRQPCQLADLLAEMQTASPHAQRLEIDAQGLPNFVTDTELLRIAIGNLIDNALKYAPAGSPVQITARSVPHKRRSGLLLSIANAPGSAGRPDAAQVFKKYYRSPGARSKTGSGLGLYLVHSMASQLGGWVRLAPTTERVQFELWIPV
jgi:signal transduction histidine kinase